MHATLTHLARQPVVHFGLIGLALFGIAHVFEEPSPDEGVVVSDETIDRFRDGLRERLDREPTELELEERVDRFVTHELLYREALRLGLDQGDPIVRRRLIQKMQFLFEDTATAVDPTEEQLSEFLAAHVDEIRIPDSVSFEHVYLSPARHEDVEADARRALASLREGGEPREIGDAFPLAAQMEGRDRADVARRFGETFADALFDAPQGSWVGPLHSNYGLHLVRSIELAHGRPARLSEVRRQVVGRWLEERRTEATDRAIERLATRHGVEIAELPREHDVVAMAAGGGR